MEDFWDVYFSCVVVESMFVYSKMDGFSGYLFALLVYYLEVGDICLVMLVGNAMYVNCTGDMTIMFFNSIFQTPAGSSYVRKVAISFWTGPVVYYVWFRFLILLVESCSKLVISGTEHLVEVVDKLSTTTVVFFRSERILKCKCLYGA